MRSATSPSEGLVSSPGILDGHVRGFKIHCPLPIPSFTFAGDQHASRSDVSNFPHRDDRAKPVQAVEPVL